MGAVETASDGYTFMVLPCDHSDNKKFAEGLRKFNPKSAIWERE